METVADDDGNIHHYEVSKVPLFKPDGSRHALVIIGRDGILVRRGWHRGTLLPVVAAERGWDAPTFLKHVCLKAGLRADAWRDPSTTVETFEAESFGDGDAEEA